MSVTGQSNTAMELIIVATIALSACSPAEEGAAPGAADAIGEQQTVSLFGERLYAQIDTTGAIAEADAALAAAPNDVEALIAAGRVRRDFWQYRGAMELYTRAMELAPDDWRPYRYRGHRHISVREFDEAIEDLEAARERASLNWDVSYHLGLAYFLAGRFGDAADEYQRCIGLAEDPAAREAHIALKLVVPFHHHHLPLPLLRPALRLARRVWLIIRPGFRPRSLQRLRRTRRNPPACCGDSRCTPEA